MKITIVTLCLLLFSCDSPSSAEHSTASLAPHVSTEPTRSDLVRKLFDLKEVIVVYGSKDESLKEAYESLATSLPSYNYRQINISIKSDLEISTADIKNKALYLVGSPENNSVLKQLQDHLPYSLNENEVSIAGQKFKGDDKVLQISVFPNPRNNQLPLYLCTGIDDQRILEFVKRKWKFGWRQILRSSFGFQVYEGNIARLSGLFTDDWKIDENQLWEFGDKDNYQSENFEYIVHGKAIDENQLDAIKERCEAAVLAVKSYLGIDKKIKPIPYHIYETTEQKGLMLHNTSQSHIDGKEVHIVHDSAFLGNDPAHHNELIISQLVAPASSKVLQKGFAIRFAEEWNRFGYQYWTALLHGSDNLPKLATIFNPDNSKFESPIVVGAMQASFVDYLIKSWGLEKFISSYPDWSPSNIDELERGWLNHISNYQAIKIEKKNKPLPYLQGFNFAHEGYNIYNGYGSRNAGASINRLAATGSNAMAIVPYTFLRNGERPAPFSIEHSVGGETDESVIKTIHQAKSKNLYTLIKPQVWMGNGWIGDMEMKNKEDWNAFFKNYNRWIRHYALLSHMYEADGLSVGVEFSKATMAYPNQWINLFKNIRKLFGGHLTYASNWGEEFESIDIWEPLDFIGLDCYYPISSNQKASRKELKKGFDAMWSRIERFAKKYNKPIVFTEAGFRSCEYSWVAPYEEPKNRPFNDEAQKVCYELFLEGMKDLDWCIGVLFWKWSCDENLRNKENRGFCPMHKSAEKVVTQYFSKK